jgi:transposase-like protein
MLLINEIIMIKSKFTEEQIRELRSNKYVVRCSDKNITYSKDFKILAVRQYIDGKSSSQIFREAGFNLYALGIDVPKCSLKRWRKTFKMQGLDGLQTDRRGGKRINKPTMEGLTAEQRIEYLEAKVAYLKEENLFLAQLRAKKKSE